MGWPVPGPRGSVSSWLLWQLLPRRQGGTRHILVKGNAKAAPAGPTIYLSMGPEPCCFVPHTARPRGTAPDVLPPVCLPRPHPSPSCPPSLPSLVPVMCHCQRRGAQLLVGREAHLHVFEQGGVAQVCGALGPGLGTLPWLRKPQGAALSPQGSFGWSGMGGSDSDPVWDSRVGSAAPNPPGMEGRAKGCTRSIPHLCMVPAGESLVRSLPGQGRALTLCLS